MRKELDEIFNWKRYPAAVFPLAFPLAGLVIFLLLARAVFEIKENDDWGYLIITVFGLILMAIALTPLYRMYKQLNKVQSDEHG